MPVDFHFDAARRVIFTIFRGDIDENEIQSVPERLLHQPGFDPSFGHVIDLSEVTRLKVSAVFAQSFARQKSIFASEAKQIIVAPQDHTFGMARMAQTLRELEIPQMKIEVVRSRQEACRMLDITFVEISS